MSLGGLPHYKVCHTYSRLGAHFRTCRARSFAHASPYSSPRRWTCGVEQKVSTPATLLRPGYTSSPEADIVIVAEFGRAAQQRMRLQDGRPCLEDAVPSDHSGSSAEPDVKVPAAIGASISALPMTCTDGTRPHVVDPSFDALSACAQVVRGLRRSHSTNLNSLRHRSRRFSVEFSSHGVVVSRVSTSR